MSLISAVLGFLLRKAALLLTTMAVLFLTYLLLQVAVPAVREASADRERLEQVTRERARAQDELEGLERQAEVSRNRVLDEERESIADNLADARRGVAEQQDNVADLRDRRDDVCDLKQRIVDAITPGSACDTAETALRVADEALDSFEGGVATAEQNSRILADPDLTTTQKLGELGLAGDDPLDNSIRLKEAELEQKQAEEASLRAAHDSVAGFVVDQWARSWRWLAVIALAALLVPPLLRTVSYFVLMPLVRRLHRPIHLADGSAHGGARLSSTDAQRTLTVRLAADEVLSARSQHVRPVRGSVRSRVLYDWTAPFVSFAAGLYGLSRVTGDGSGTSATLATPDDPDSYLMRIDFEDHPGLVMRPSHVVGVVGTPQLQTRWRWGIQALATWQVRYIMFTGTGALIVQGTGDVVAGDPEGGSARMDQHLVMGFDSRLGVGVARNEVFLPYLWGRTPLVVDEFMGTHPFFWQKNNAAGPSNPIAKTFDAIFSALGKLLGF